MEKWSHWCISCCAGCQSEAHPLTKSAIPSSLIECAAHTLLPALSALTIHVYSEELVSKGPWVNRIFNVAFKVPFYLQNTIKVGKMGLSFTGLEHILKFLPRKEKSLIQSIIHINWVGNQEIIFLNYICCPECSEKSQQTTAGVGGRGGWGVARTVHHLLL